MMTMSKRLMLLRVSAMFTQALVTVDRPRWPELRRRVAARDRPPQRVRTPYRRAHPVHGRARVRTIRRGGGPRCRGRPPTIAATAASISASVSVRSGAEPQPVGEALLVGGERDAAVDVEQADAAQQLAATGADGAFDRGRGRRPSATTMARSRSTSGCRPTAGARSGARRPSARPSIATSPTITAWPGPQLPRVDDRRVELADERMQPAVDRRARRAARDAGRPPLTPHDTRGARGRAGSRGARGSPWRRRGRRRASGRFQAGASAAPVSANPSRHHSRASVPTARSPCRSRTRRRRRCPGAGSSRRRRAGCRAGCGAAASDRATAGWWPRWGRRPAGARRRPTARRSRGRTPRGAAATPGPW